MESIVSGVVLLLDTSVRAVVVALLVAATLALFRVHGSRARHAVWLGVLLAMLTMPVLRLVVPPLSVSAPAHWATSAFGGDVLTAAGWSRSASPEIPGAIESAPEAASLLASGSAWLLVASVVYCGGVILCAMRLLRGWVIARGVVRRARPIDRVEAGSSLQAFESSELLSPVTVGLIRPRILLPEAWRSWSTVQLRAVMAHEAAHADRRDPLVAALARMNRAIFWFHPLAWALDRMLANLAEDVCDDMALLAVGERRLYADMLIDFSRVVQSRGARLTAYGTGVAGPGALERRVSRVLRDTARPRSSRLTLVATALCAAAATAGVAAVDRSPAAQPVARMTPPQAPATPAAAAPVADRMDWPVHSTEHFDIHYAPALEPELTAITDAAERAYEAISARLKHSLGNRVPLILYETRGDFERQTVVPGIPLEVMPRIASFSEPAGNQIVILMDEDPARWVEQVTHELTHVFAFDILPRGTGRSVPTWIDEGLASYMVGVWSSEDVDRLRGRVAADETPKVSTVAAREDEVPELSAALGHAVFDFVEERYGEDRIRQFLFALRRDILAGTTDLYESGLDLAPDAFDLAVEQYLTERFR